MTKFTKGAAIAGWIAISCFTTACTSEVSVNAAIKPERERKPAPDFTLKDANGATLRLSDYKGKVVLLDFWATWCGPCKVEIPWFMEFEQSYKDKGFAVLGVSMDEEGWNAVKPYIQERKINYRVAVGNDVIGQLYGGLESLPTTFLIDRAGLIAKTHIGLDAGGKGAFENEITNLLEAPRVGRLRPHAWVPALLASPR